MQDYHRVLTQKEIKEFVLERFQSVKKSNKVKELVEFQAMNKFLIMAHNQEEHKVLGRIVASNKKVKFSEMLEEYEKNLGLCLQFKPTIKTHSNVIMHIFGFFSKEFSHLERDKFFDLLKNYKNSISNLTVVDEDGDKLNFSYDGETFEESKYIILNQKLGNYDLIAEYDLDNFMELKNGIWKKDFLFTFDVLVMVEEDMELIFVNSRPVDVTNAKGINCIGCQLTLEYIQDEKISTKQISSSQGEFEIEFLSNKEVFEIEFIEGGTQLLNFDVKNKDQLYVLKIPLENFLNPYDIYFTEKDDTNLDQ